MVNKYPVPSTECCIREESFGGIIYQRGTGKHRYLDPLGLEVLSAVDGKQSVYEIAKALAPDELGVAKRVLYLLSLEQESWITLSDSKSNSCITASEFKTKSKDALSTPMFVSLAIIEECNAICNHCYKLPYQTGSLLSTSEIKRTIDLLAQMHVVQVSITGGEPFLSHDAIEIIGHAADSISQVSVASNGLLIKRETAEDLARTGVSTIQIGINAVFDDRNGEMREENRAQLEGSLANLNAAGIPIQFGAVLTKNVVACLREIEEIASEFSISAIRLSPMVNYHSGCSECRAQDDDIVGTVLGLQRSQSDVQGITYVFDDGIFDAVRDSEAALENRERYCYMGTGILHIEADGAVYPCTGLLSSEFYLGNVRDCQSARGLYELWQTSPILKTLRSITIDSLQQCKGCEYLRLCAGGCRNSAYWETGSLTGAYPFCEINKAVIRDYYENNSG